MTPGATLLERLLPAGPRDPAAARAGRWLGAHGLPTGREEAWRYTPVAEIVERLGSAVPAPPQAVSRSVVDELAGDHRGPRLVLVNGRFAADLSDLADLPAGIWCGRLRDAPSTRSAVRLVDAAEPADGFQALNRAAARGAAVVLTESDARSTAPIHLVHLAAPGDGLAAAHLRVLVDVGAGSRLELVETFAALPGATFVNASTAIRVGSGATLTHHRLLAESAGATHVGRTVIEQAHESVVRSTSLLLDAEIARHALDVRLLGPDARIEVDGLYLPAGHQRHDLVVTVDHAASRGTSTQRVKGVVDDHGRGSFSGHVIVRADTVGTDARQSNRNLLLAPTAQADTRPWLEIFADDVRCTHGATVGRLDDDALFYLRSRGIPVAEGRAMLTEAFVREITDAIEPASLRDHVVATTARAMAGASS